MLSDIHGLVRLDRGGGEGSFSGFGFRFGVRARIVFGVRVEGVRV